MKIICPDIMGRLANQLFQVIAAYYFADKYRFEPMFPPSTLNPDIWPNYFRLFNIRILDQDYKWDYFIEEKNHNYIDLSNCSGNTRIQGYFQKYTYVYPVIDKARKLFKIPQSDLNSVGIHIRRGDFLNYPTLHRVLPAEYYQKAIAEIDRDCPDCGFIITSDDKDWCEQFFKSFISDGRATVTEKNNSPLDDFYLLCSCKHHIIANSSYSQLASMLCRNPNKIVYSPPGDTNSWFGIESKSNTIDIIPPNYKIIKI